MDRITSKKMLQHWIENDLAARGLELLPKFFRIRKPIVYFTFLLRKAEYLVNTRRGYLGHLYCKWILFRLKMLGVRLGFSILPNTCGPGLYLVHWGSIVISSKATIGKNARIHSCVNIAANTTIGDNVYIGPGAKILDGIELGDDVTIGANAVVTKSFPQGKVMLVGVPATPLEQ